MREKSLEDIIIKLDEQYQSETSVQKSTLDTSVNFIIKRDTGFSETRFVQREDKEIIVYLSSQTGCKQACRFCHLTQSGQTQLSDETLEHYLQQTQIVLNYYSHLVEQGDIQPAEFVNFNFMSRGELFANQKFLQNSENVFAALHREVENHQLTARFKCSTIMPQALANIEFHQLFSKTSPDIYYSLYSLNSQWRKRWMPKAMQPDIAMKKLQVWQKFSRKIPIIHFALIEENKDYDNSSEENIDQIIQIIKDHKLRVDINIVKYNPANPSLGKEPSLETIDRVVQQFSDGLSSSQIQLVGRVGYDVKASCGMFIHSSDRIQLEENQPSSNSKIILPQF